MKRKNVLRMLVLLTALGFGTLFQLQANLRPPTPPTPPTVPIAPTPPTAPLAPLSGFQVNLQTTDNSALSLVEMTELKKNGLQTSKKAYTGPQTVQALMEAFDGTYNRYHSETTVSVYSNAGSGTSSISILYDGTYSETTINGLSSTFIRSKTTTKTTMSGPSGTFTSTRSTSETPLSRLLDTAAEKRLVSQFTNAEIDARYPRKAWLQMLLDKGITIENFGAYASYLSKRHTLALLQDNPNLRRTGLLGIPPTDDWTTYKTAYINRLVNDHTQLRKIAEQAERAKARAERAKQQAEQIKTRAERVKARAERAKQQAEQAKAQISRQMERTKAQIERTKGELQRTKEELQETKPLAPSPNQPKNYMRTKSRYPAL